MKIATAPHVRPDRSDDGKGLTLVPDPPDGAGQVSDARSFDPTQGRKIGAEPYDDPTQGRKIGSDRYDDPTRAR
jgi:hypothetical protein